MTTPGWYPDPASGELRYFDGERWLDIPPPDVQVGERDVAGSISSGHDVVVHEVEPTDNASRGDASDDEVQASTSAEASKAPDREPGWYDDPSRRHEFRFWDGAEWTRHVANRGVASDDERGLGKIAGPNRVSLGERARSKSKGLAVRVKETTGRAVEKGRERAAQRVAANERRQWEQRCSDLREHLGRLSYKGSTNVPFILQPNETAFFQITNVALVESRKGASEYIGRSSGASLYVGYGLSVAGGSSRGTIVEGREALSPIDHGLAVVTNARVIYQGQLQTREWAYAELLSVAPFGTTVMLGVSNRSTTSGLSVPDAFDALLGWLDVGLANFRGELDQVRGQVAGELEQLEANPPMLAP